MSPRARVEQLAIISRRLVEDGTRPIYVRRARRLRPDDSGWVVTAGETTDEVPEFAVADLGVAHIEHLIDHWPELADVFADPRDECALTPVLWAAPLGRKGPMSNCEPGSTSS
jgi:hypothetical protein